MRTWHKAAPCVALLALMTAAAAQTPERLPDKLAEQQLAFADKLYGEGEKAFALLEYKRFLFRHGDRPGALKAAMTAARLYVAYVGDVEAAKRTLRELAANHPNTQAEQQARQFLEFIEVNSDYDAKPLGLFVSAVCSEELGQAAAAAAGYEELHRKYPKARLADAALLGLARVLLENLAQAKKAGDVCQVLLRGYPRSPHVPDALYYQAAAMEKQHGPTREVLQAYRQVAGTYPNTDAARRAAERLELLESSRVVLRRQYDKGSVQGYQVLKEGYLQGADRYVVQILLAAGLSERALRATLEDALLAHCPKRARPTHSVTVEAYSRYPQDLEGSVAWSPDQPPQYTVKKPKGQDVLKDVLIDILRKL